jgi:hypothetical protein
MKQVINAPLVGHSDQSATAPWEGARFSDRKHVTEP